MKSRTKVAPDRPPIGILSRLELRTLKAAARLGLNPDPFGREVIERTVENARVEIDAHDGPSTAILSGATVRPSLLTKGSSFPYCKDQDKQ